MAAVVVGAMLALAGTAAAPSWTTVEPPALALAEGGRETRARHGQALGRADHGDGDDDGKAAKP